MILRWNELTKSTRKGWATSVELLRNLAEFAGLPPPTYEFDLRGSKKRPQHFCKVRFRVPKFLLDGAGYEEGGTGWVAGSAVGGQKAKAKSLASLEAVQRLEDSLALERGSLQQRLDEIRKERKEHKELLEATRPEVELPGVTWDNVPIDPSFSETLPASRFERIDFTEEVREDPIAFFAARILTLASEEGRPPLVEVHTQGTNTSDVKRFANIKLGSKAITFPRLHELENNLSARAAQFQTLYAFGHHILKHSRKKPTMSNKMQRAAEMMDNAGTDSFGMAKLFVTLPKHQHDELKELLRQVPKLPESLKGAGRRENTSGGGGGRRRRMPGAALNKTNGSNAASEERKLRERIRSFRAHQACCPLPVDSVESDIPHDAEVTIVRGGTGSGKTTRYPLMLSLFGPDDTRVVVAQPRRLACQTAARRVAYEQDVRLGRAAAGDCPIGYSIRFESYPSSGPRTVDFQTPGVILRRAVEDPLLSDVTHLVIDEVHERNADGDLLLALAKEAAARRLDHETLPPLRIVLMSATLDASHWESYFGGNETVALVDVPETRRYPIDIIHLDDSSFPKLRAAHVKALKDKVLLSHKVGSDEYDEALCEATAALAGHIFKSQQNADGSVLCFLPGMDEIRLVDNFLKDLAPRKGDLPFRIRYLHSSLSSREQEKAFLPGPKVILSTNIAETSVTIPDVKVVIDTGRERQHSLMESSSGQEGATVVGSQLATVNISRASAKQRAGRAGRVSAGTCYRLYTRQQLESKFPPYTLPEIQRMDLSQIVLHTLSMYCPMGGGHPLQLLLNTPDPPSELRLRHALHALAQQGHIRCDKNERRISLTPLGDAVASLPVTPRVGRMLFLGLVLRATEPALSIAALLSVPKLFSTKSSGMKGNHSSDIVRLLEDYRDYSPNEWSNPRRKLFRQVDKVKQQLHRNMQEFIAAKTRQENESFCSSTDEWNANSERIAAIVSLICCATPHIAHLVGGRNDFATRDLAGSAHIHPRSSNFDQAWRAHWYVYHTLLTTKRPYLNVTTAVSPVELALFADYSTMVGREKDGFEFLFAGELDRFDADEEEDGPSVPSNLDDIFIADQWVPVAASKPSQRKTILELRQTLHEMLQQVASEPNSLLTSPIHHQIVSYVLSAIDHQRVGK